MFEAIAEGTMLDDSMDADLRDCLIPKRKYQHIKYTPPMVHESIRSEFGIFVVELGCLRNA